MPALSAIKDAEKLNRLRPASWTVKCCRYSGKLSVTGKSIHATINYHIIVQVHNCICGHYTEKWKWKSTHDQCIFVVWISLINDCKWNSPHYLLIKWIVLDHTVEYSNIKERCIDSLNKWINPQRIMLIEKCKFKKLTGDLIPFWYYRWKVYGNAEQIHDSEVSGENGGGKVRKSENLSFMMMEMLCVLCSLILIARIYSLLMFSWTSLL